MAPMGSPHPTSRPHPSPAELEDLEDVLALARLERDRALGRTRAPIPHSEARRALLEAAGTAH